MIYPTICQYCDVMRSARNVFATLSAVQVELDSAGEPLYRASGRSVRFNVSIGSERRALRLFTSRMDLSKLSLGEDAQILFSELYVASFGRHFDLVVEPPFLITSPQLPPMVEICENRARFCRDDKWGFTDSNGDMVIAPIYDIVGDFSEGRAVCCVDQLWGLIDSMGGVIIEPIYDELSYDGSGLCYTEIEGRWGVSDRLGRVIVQNEWDWVSEFCYDMLLVERDGKYGYVDLHGVLVIGLKYDDATSFDHNHYATVKANGRSYQIDKEEYRV